MISPSHARPPLPVLLLANEHAGAKAVDNRDRGTCPGGDVSGGSPAPRPVTIDPATGVVRHKANIVAQLRRGLLRLTKCRISAPSLSELNLILMPRTHRPALC